MRDRSAPSAARSANSRSRPADRASRRFATFPQAIKSTRSTAPNNTRMGSREEATKRSRRGSTWSMDWNSGG